MMRYLQRIAERIDAFTLRERAIMFGAIATVVVAFVYALFIEPEFARSARLTRDIAQRQAEARNLQEQFAKLIQARHQDPDRDNRERLARAQARLSSAEAEIAAEERKFTGPAQARAVLEEFIARNKHVRLVELRTIPPTSITETRPAGVGPQAKPVPAERVIFRHGFTMTVSGGYLELLGYLADLERLPTQLYWGTLGLDAALYPVVTMKVTVYTLSLDSAWMNV
jgi:MSHA biogenesis protein MshJ